MLIAGVVLVVVGLALAIGIDRLSDKAREENPFFDAFEEWLFHPALTTLMYAGRGVAVVGLILVAIAII
jgi:hypothetical protein